MSLSWTVGDCGGYAPMPYILWGQLPLLPPHQFCRLCIAYIVLQQHPYIESLPTLVYTNIYYINIMLYSDNTQHNKHVVYVVIFNEKNSVLLT